MNDTMIICRITENEKETTFIIMDQKDNGMQSIGVSTTRYDKAVTKAPDPLLGGPGAFDRLTGVMAGVAGFEPTNTRVKVLCLTTWPHPNAQATHKKRKWGG